MEQYLRLNTLKTMIRHRYPYIWDCCCDHGLLGISLLNDDLADQVHFVDQVDTLIASLDEKLSDQYANSRWKTHCIDMAQLNLPRTEGSDEPAHLMVIAGVGGDLLIELVKAILVNNPDIPIEFILCPVRQNYQVRQALIKANLSLIDENLVKEKGLYYEVLHVSSVGGVPISSVGSLMWDFTEEAHRIYLKRTLEHYQRRLRGNPQEVTPIIQQYTALLDSFS